MGALITPTEYEIFANKTAALNLLSKPPQGCGAYFSAAKN